MPPLSFVDDLRAILGAEHVRTDDESRTKYGTDALKRGPMANAFVANNPLLPNEYFVPKGIDKFVVDMNKDVPHSLLACRGKYTVKVATFTNCPTVELLLNGKSLGTKNLADFPDRMITWELPYQPGTLEARGISAGQAKAAHQLKTAGEPAQLRLRPDRTALRADGRDLGA